MTVYVVTRNGIETGTFKSFRSDSVRYETSNGAIKFEHPRNVFFSKKNARYHNLRQHGITRPILNGSS